MSVAIDYQMTEQQNKPEKKKRGSGSNKSRRKKREYQAHVHAMLGSGYVNDERGNWVSASFLKDGKKRDRAEKQASRFAGTGGRKR